MKILAKENIQAAGSAMFAAAAAAAIAPIAVSPLGAAAFVLTSNVVDRLANDFFRVDSLLAPKHIANSNKQITRYVITVAGGLHFLGFAGTATAFMLNQGAIMLTKRVTLHLA